MAVFPERLVMLRKQKGLTQKQLAAAIGGSERGVQNYEIEQRRPTYEMLIALADYFGVSIDYLTGRTDNPEVNK